MVVELLPIAFGIGLVVNLEPCCGGATVLWSSALAGSPRTSDRLKAVGLGVGRAGVLAGVGALVGLVGLAISLPLAAGFLILAAVFATVGLYELRKAFRAQANACPAAFDRHGRSPLVNGTLMLLPPPLVFVLFSFFGDLSAVPPVDGALVLGAAGLGLGLPLFVFAASPRLYRVVAARLGGGRAWPVKLVGAFILLGAALYVLFAVMAATGGISPPG